MQNATVHSCVHDQCALEPLHVYTNAGNLDGWQQSIFPNKMIATFKLFPTKLMSAVYVRVPVRRDLCCWR
jgi:hypothetical protein